MPLNFIDPVMTSGLLKTSNNLSELTATIETVYANTGIDHTVPVGVIFPWASADAVAPVGWLFCNGQAVSRSAYSALFAVIGELYGGGNGTTTFNLPDLRGRVIAGVDTVSGSLNVLTPDFFDNATTDVGATGGYQNTNVDTTSIRSATTGTFINVLSNDQFSIVQPTMLLQYMIRTDVANVGAP